MVRIFTVSIGQKYWPLLRALKNSVAYNCPQARFDVAQCDPLPQTEFGVQKWNEWTEYVQQWNGANIVFVDCDAILLRDPGIVFEEHSDFDVAYGQSDAGSTLFVRSNERSLAFMRKAQTHTLSGAIKNPGDCKLYGYDCKTWNARIGFWREYKEGVTGVIHVDAVLRRMALGHQRPRPNMPEWLNKVWELWRFYESHPSGSSCGGRSAATRGSSPGMGRHSVRASSKRNGKGCV